METTRAKCLGSPRFCARWPLIGNGCSARVSYHDRPYGDDSSALGCLQVQKKKRVSHYLPFNLVFNSVTRCPSGSEGEKQTKQRLRKGIATLILPAEATKIPVGSQDHFTSQHCWNGLMNIFFSLLIKSQDEYALLSLALIHSQIWLFGAGASGGTNARKRFGLGGPGIWWRLTGSRLLSILARGRPEQKCHRFLCVLSASLLPKTQVVLVWKQYKGSLIKQSPFSPKGAEYLPLCPLPPLFPGGNGNFSHPKSGLYTEKIHHLARRCRSREWLMRPDALI